MYSSNKEQLEYFLRKILDNESRDTVLPVLRKLLEEGENM